MPNKRANRRKRNRHVLKDSDPRPSNIDNIRDMDSNYNPALIKFLSYTMNRKVYGLYSTNQFVIFSLSSYFLLKDEYPNYSIMPDYPPIDYLENEIVKGFHVSPGIGDSVVELLKIKTEDYKSLAKICVLVVDEVALMPEVKYCNGEVVGFEDDGRSKSNLPAEFVTIIWVQCVGEQWLVPLAYYFTHKSSSADLLKDFLFEAISKLDGIGLDVIGIITKMRINFYELSQALNISPENQLFKVGNKEIVFLFDVPQLMNITRNNMMKYKLKFEGMQTSWKYVKQFFKIQNQGVAKPKITMAHVKPDINQRSLPQLSIELLSSVIATEMRSCISSGKLPESANGTAECIDLFGKLFDILNSSVEHSTNDYCYAYKGTEHQFNFMQKMINFFANLKVYNKSDQDCTDHVKFINGWLISIKGVLKMWDFLSQKNCPFLLTRNINCESLDKFIWLLRWQVFSVNDPTPSNFLEIYSSFFISSYFEDDLDDDSDFDIEDHAKEIFNKSPPIEHIDETNISNNLNFQHEANKKNISNNSGDHSELDIFEDFIKSFAGFFDAD